MKKACFCLLVFFITIAVNAQNKVKIAAAEITFHFVNNDVDGSLSGFSSSSSIDLQNPTNSVFEGFVAVKTLKTGNFLRDWHLKTGKYFDADVYPKITFKSTAVQETKNGFTVKGLLTLKNTSKEITIDFKKMDNELIGTTTLFSYDYGIEMEKEREQNKVEVKLAFQLK